ncbi:MAG: family 78 glycoside hydrolase catalytic domain [Acutalibacter sp.]
MKLTHLRTNHVEEPLGLFLKKPVFSWVAEDTGAKRQESARILVTAQGETVYDSGRRQDISSLGFEAPVELAPRTRYHWQVTVWGDNGDWATAASWFETAKQGEPWQAQWITGDFPDPETQPLLAKTFSLSQEVKSARAYVCGVGIYELEVNGKKAGDEYLLPGYHCYDFHLEYQTFDLTGLLQKGENTVGLALGPGWYKGDIIFDRYHNLYGDTMQAICEVRVTLADGTEQLIPTDLTWKSYPSPVTFSNIYDGEHYDAQKEVPGWSAPGCAIPAQGVKAGSEDTAKLIARLGPKVMKKASFTPTVLTTKRGETVLDFGQNMTGWVEFDVHEPAGTQVVLTYGEVLQDGCFYRDNLRSAKAEYRYLSKGEPAHVRPHFTFYGFRYVKVEGISQVRAEDFTAWHIRSDIDPIGSIETADSRVNQLFHNAMWGQFDNFLDVPTDCPQRDERLGWTGDAAIISATACKNLYMPAFFHHFIHNVGEEEQYYGGAVPFFVPAPKAPDEKDAFWLSGNTSGCAIWSDVATMMPWAVYENYGDLTLLREEYPVMKTWVERIRKDDEADGSRGLWLRGRQLGDWLALDREDGDTQNPFGATNLPYTASAFYYYSTSLTAKAAKALGYSEDQQEYEALCRKIKGAILEEYFHEDGTFRIPTTQTACVLSLFFGLYPQGKADVVLSALKERIQAKGGHLDTGFCGTPFLCRALSDHGAGDVAYSLFLNDDYPSWLYEVNMGATTVWERWNSILPDGSISGTGMNSLNHYAYGSIVDWMYRCLCGLNPVEEAPGYKKALIRPMPDQRLPWAKLKLDTASGTYRVEWRYVEGALHGSVTVPFDCQATLILPDGTQRELSAGTFVF